MRERFWELPLEELDQAEWEALCDQCGKCCLIKLEDEDTGEIVFTRLACRLFSNQECRCGDYPNRLNKVEDCLVLTMESIPKSEHWLPKTCAYVLRFHGKSLPHWHYLKSKNFDLMHQSGHSVKGLTESEDVVQNWEEAIDYIYEEFGK